MRKLILKMSMSVDGFVAGPNGEIDWIFKSMDDKAAAWTLDALWQAGLHIMGSRTFNDMATYWPYSKEPFAAPMNEIPKAVFTRKGLGENKETTRAFKDAGELNHYSASNPPSPYISTWADAYIASGDMADEIKKLKGQPGRDIVAHGGAGFAQSLVTTGLIDEYKLLVHPIVLGKGLPIFSMLTAPANLKLEEVITFASGAAAHVFRPA